MRASRETYSFLQVRLDLRPVKPQSRRDFVRLATGFNLCAAAGNACVATKQWSPTERLVFLLKVGTHCG